MAANDPEGGQPEAGKDVKGGLLIVILTCTKNKFILTQQIRLRNDLMLIVGYIEFFNALDFPANLWNTIPVPTFALALMIVGGTTALLASTTAFWDLRRSLHNVRLLREERVYLERDLEIA